MTESTLTTDDGLAVRVAIVPTDDGPMLVVGGVNCDLEGIAPGEYLLVAHAAIS